MVTFTQNMGGGFQTPNLSEVIKICTEHPECKDCPLKDNDVQIQGTLTRCETGRMKGRK